MDEPAPPASSRPRGCLTPIWLVVAVVPLLLLGGCVAWLAAADDGSLATADPSEFRLSGFRCAVEPGAGGGPPRAAGSLLNTGDRSRSFLVRVEAVDLDRPDQPISWNEWIDLGPGQSEEFDVLVSNWARSDPQPDFDPLDCGVTVYDGG